MQSVELKNIKKSFGEIEIIKSCNLSIEEGEFIVLVGPSGCGKSTLLRSIAGLEAITSGQLVIDGQDMTEATPVTRGVAMVFQSYALYPHMSVAENIGFGLKIAKTDPEGIEKRVREVAEILHLGHLLERKPKELSGGQRQRVAIGRALARKPRIFLFDEPLSNLDASLRAEMRVELAKLHQELGNTMIYVTHDQVEAMTLATRMVVMQGGEIEQVGTPLELFNRPATRFVAGFLGQPPMNFIKISSSKCSEQSSSLKLSGGFGFDLDAIANPTGAIPNEIGIRPEDFSLTESTEALCIFVDVIEQLGSDTIVYARMTDDQKITVRLQGQVLVETGQPLYVMPNTNRVILFDNAGRNMSLIN